jgi:hypothetical protein
MSAAHAELPRIDLNALRVNQACIIALLILAFILNASWIVLCICLVMAIGTLIGIPGFKPLYQYGLQPLNIVKPDIERDNPEPHRFAQGFGAFVLLIATLALFSGAATIGWALSWLVITLAAVNLFLGFCAGCFVYYWLNRLGVPGFVKAPPANTIPGMRPRQKASQ